MSNSATDANSATDGPKARLLQVAADATRAGGRLPASVIDALGGWAAVAEFAPQLVDDPLLRILTALTVDSLSQGPVERAEGSEAAVCAVAAAVVASADPAVFGDCVDLLLRDPVATTVTGELLFGSLLCQAAPPQAAPSDSADPTRHCGSASRFGMTAQRAADALEACTRLVAGGWGSRRKLEVLLEEVHTPQPPPYARAAVRAVATTIDLWPQADDLTSVIDVLTGATAAGADISSAASDQLLGWASDIDSDGAWALATIELTRALRAVDPADADTHLHAAGSHLDIAQLRDQRSDAQALRLLVDLLRDLLRETAQQLRATNQAQPGPHVKREQRAPRWRVRAAILADQVHRYALAGSGLHHWSGDRKTVALLGWSRLADDLAVVHEQLEEPSWYEPARVLADITQVYAASRSYEIVRRDEDLDGVTALIGPSIEHGFASQVGLMRHLADHVQLLKSRAADDDDDADVSRELAAARHLLERAREVASRPKDHGGTLPDEGTPPSSPQADGAPGGPPPLPSPLPPMLAELLGSTAGSVGIDARQGASAVWWLVEDALEDRQTASVLIPDRITQAAQNKVLAAVSSSADYAGDVALAVKEVTALLIQFVRARMNAQSSRAKYLFKPNPKEAELAEDLANYLEASPLYSHAQVEVPQVAGGRVDVQLKFTDFTLYIELKVDDTITPLPDLARYIAQTAGYQQTGVRIGFLVVLRLAGDRGPGLHLTQCVDHTTLTVPGENEPRHVVVLAVPGNQTQPSKMI